MFQPQLPHFAPPESRCPDCGQAVGMGLACHARCFRHQNPIPSQFPGSAFAVT